jgi:hypothetical protein
MKTLVLPLFVAAVFAVGVGCGGTPQAEKMPGLYVCEADSTAYFVVNVDGTCLLKEGGIVTDGTWELRGDLMVVELSMGTEVVEIERTRLIDDSGLAWVKQ